MDLKNKKFSEVIKAAADRWGITLTKKQSEKIVSDVLSLTDEQLEALEKEED